MAVRQALEQRFAECKLQLHAHKTKIVYCHDANRLGPYPERSFDFLVLHSDQRGIVNRKGEQFIAFVPPVSNKAAKKMRCRFSAPPRRTLQRTFPSAKRGALRDGMIDQPVLYQITRALLVDVWGAPDSIQIYISSAGLEHKPLRRKIRGRIPMIL
jgi:hypothetical protein